MVTTRFYLDSRACQAGAAAPLKLVITKKGVRALISLNLSLLPTHWDARRQMVIVNPRKQQINAMLAERKVAVDNILFRMEMDGELGGLSSIDIKNRVLAVMHPDDVITVKHPTFVARLIEVIGQRSPGTQTVYKSTLSRLRSYLGKHLDSLTFEDIDVRWLRDFDAYLAKTSPSRNARNIHFRNIRAVFNDAITDELITCYPFRKFKITPEPTRKRALTVDQLRSVFSADVAPHEQRYIDCFKIIFMLCGINTVDLCRLKGVSNEGRVEYIRAKTHRPYSIKVEPECAELLERYRGEQWLLSYLDTNQNYRSFTTRLAMNLRDIRDRMGLPGLSTYWARHSWATIAASLDIPKETIAAALGHGGNTVTDIYIDFDRRKIDEANRRVLDWVLYGKK